MQFSIYNWYRNYCKYGDACSTPVTIYFLKLKQAALTYGNNIQWEVKILVVEMQTVRTLIRLLLEEQSDQSLQC